MPDHTNPVWLERFGVSSLFPVLLWLHFLQFPTAFDDVGLAGPKYRAESPPLSLPTFALWVTLQSALTFALP